MSSIEQFYTDERRAEDAVRVLIRRKAEFSVRTWRRGIDPEIVGWKVEMVGPHAIDDAAAVSQFHDVHVRDISESSPEEHLDEHEDHLVERIVDEICSHANCPGCWPSDREVVRKAARLAATLTIDRIRAYDQRCARRPVNWDRVLQGNPCDSAAQTAGGSTVGALGNEDEL